MCGTSLECRIDEYGYGMKADLVEATQGTIAAILPDYLLVRKKCHTWPEWEKQKLKKKLLDWVRNR